MGDQNRPVVTPPGVTVVRLPYEIEYSNARRATRELDAAFAPDVTTVVVDLTACTFANKAGVREIGLAARRAAAEGAELRVVVPPQLRRSFTLTGLDQLVGTYPTLDAALSESPAPDQQARTE
jgi:anti-anti-sigma factor